jgi:hypothetical protein
MGCFKTVMLREVAFRLTRAARERSSVIAMK